MSSDGSGRPEQRFSRFSQSTYGEIAPPRPVEELSLTEIATRALNGGHDIPRGPAPSDNGRFRQPPPPEPSPYWSETARQPVEGPPQPPRHPPETLRPAFGRETPPAGAPAPQERPRPAQPDPAAHALQAAPPVEVHRQAPAAPAPEDGPRKPGMFARGLGAAREKVGPALANSAFWLAHNLRRREIRKRYNKALVFGHTRIADRKLEKLFFVPTLQSQLIDPAPDRGILYDGPTPAAVFDWVMSLVTDDLRQFAFIDIRAGRGRTSLLAAKRNFNHILAYEYDEPVFEDLRMNVAQYPRSLMVCRNIDCHRGDIDGIRLPDQPCVIYFSGAWRQQMIPGVMNYVRQTYRQSPRRIYVILENVDEETALPGDDIFKKVEPGLGERLKLRLLSPMDFRVYRSIA